MCPKAVYQCPNRPESAPGNNRDSAAMEMNNSNIYNINKIREKFKKRRRKKLTTMLTRVQQERICFKQKYLLIHIV